MTASGEASLEQRAADAGAAGFLRKPFGQTQVLAELRAVSDARQQAGHGNASSDSAPRRRQPQRKAVRSIWTSIWPKVTRGISSPARMGSSATTSSLHSK